jgi:hypothetical protein
MDFRRFTSGLMIEAGADTSEGCSCELFAVDQAVSGVTHPTEISSLSKASQI